MYQSLAHKCVAHLALILLINIMLDWAPWQEFRLHGVKLQGPCKKLKSAGHKGAHTGNIQRDMLRTVHGLDYIVDVSLLKLDLGILGVQ